MLAVDFLVRSTRGSRMLTALMVVVRQNQIAGPRLILWGKKIPGVEIGKLAYFGASMFWRASVHDWRVGTDKSSRIALGLFEEKLRRYLLGEIAFPDGVVLFIT